MEWGDFFINYVEELIISGILSKIERRSGFGQNLKIQSTFHHCFFLNPSHITHWIHVESFLKFSEWEHENFFYIINGVENNKIKESTNLIKILFTSFCLFIFYKIHKSILWMIDVQKNLWFFGEFCDFESSAILI
jgi:hypothetical protein